MPLDPNGHQGLYGEAYLYTLASAAGLLTSRMNLDRDGVDWQFAHPGPRGTKRSPKLEVQVKSCSAPEREGDHWKYRLKARHFNNIAGPGFDVPRFLALVVVPQQADLYAQCDTHAMKLSHAAYWASFANEPLAPADSTSPDSLTVRVSTRNLITTTTLIRLIDGDLEGATT